MANVRESKIIFPGMERSRKIQTEFQLSKYKDRTNYNKTRYQTQKSTGGHFVLHEVKS